MPDKIGLLGMTEDEAATLDPFTISARRCPGRGVPVSWMCHLWLSGSCTPHPLVPQHQEQTQLPPFATVLSRPSLDSPSHTLRRRFPNNTHPNPHASPSQDPQSNNHLPDMTFDSPAAFIPPYRRPFPTAISEETPPHAWKRGPAHTRSPFSGAFLWGRGCPDGTAHWARVGVDLPQGVYFLRCGVGDRACDGSGESAVHGCTPYV